MKKKATAKALLMSVLSMLLCLSMLIGTTFAWFTDSVTSGVNKIVAGNLDVEVQYNVLDENGKITDKWENLEGADSLFNKDTLWEPGHTEYAVLKIYNAGSLALKYQAKVDVVSEIGSINVNGDHFKLSDYLYYGVAYSEINTVPSSLDREAAAAMATEELGAYDSGEGETLEPGATKYMTLAITMPATIENEANYKKGYNAPSIDLGVSVLATQARHEDDSFGDDYDKDANYPAPTFTSTSNATFPVTATAALNATTGDYVAELEVKLVGEETPVNVGTVTIPAERVDPNQLPVVNINPAEQNKANFATVASSGKAAKYYEITVDYLLPGNGEVEVVMQLDQGLIDVVIWHDDDKNPETDAVDVGADYNAGTGKATFQTASFSPFMLEYKAENVAKVGDVYYSTLADAVAAAQPKDVVTLLKSAEGSGIVIPEEKYTNKYKPLTIDLNGYTYTVGSPTVGSAGTETNGFQILQGNHVTIKNGILAAGADSAKILIQNYSSITLTDVTLKGRDITQYVLSNNCGTTKLNGNTSIIAAEGQFALDSCKFGSYSAPKVTINTTGIIDGKVEVTGGTLTVDDGRFTNMIDCQSGTLSIEGGTFPDDPSADVAKNYVMIRNGGQYSVKSFTTAVKEAKEGETVVLCNDVARSVPKPVEVTNSMTIDLNGHKFYAKESWDGSVPAFLFAVQNPSTELTIKNGALENAKSSGINVANGAKVTLDNVQLTVDETKGTAIYVPADSNDVELTLKNNCVVNGYIGVSVAGINSKVTVDNSTINSKYIGITQNGTYAPNTYTLTNSQITGLVAVYISNTATAEKQTLIMENCTATGETAVAVKHTNATITGCTLIATAANKTTKENGNGNCTTGYAFEVSTNSSSENVTGTIAITDCKDGNDAPITKDGVFVFQTAESASVTVDGEAICEYNTYG